MNVALGDQILGYLIIAGKSVIIYIFIIGAIRLFGKKELAQLSIFDLVFILLISNSVQNAMVGSDSTVFGGMSAAIGLFVANYILKYFARKNAKFNHLIQGKMIILAMDGKINKAGMEEAMISKEELEQAVREHGVTNIEAVNLAVLEVDGNISVLSENYKKRTVKLRHKVQISRSS